MKAKLIRYGYGIGDYTDCCNGDFHVPKIGDVFTIKLNGYEDVCGPMVDVKESLYRPDGSLMNDNAISLISFEIIEEN